jgi:hypothetical protein
MTVPKYLETFRRAVRELEGYEINEIDEKRSVNQNLIRLFRLIRCADLID